MGKRYGLHKYGGERGGYAEYAAFDTIERERDDAASRNRADMIERTALLNEISERLADNRASGAVCRSLRAAHNVVGNLEKIALADLARQAATDLREAVQGEEDVALTDLDTVLTPRYFAAADGLRQLADDQIAVATSLTVGWQTNLLDRIAVHPEEWHTPSAFDGPECRDIRFRIFAGAARPATGRGATGAARDFGLAVYVGEDARERLHEALAVLRNESTEYHPGDYQELLPYRIVTCRRDSDTGVAPHRALREACKLGRTMGREKRGRI